MRARSILTTLVACSILCSSASALAQQEQEDVPVLENFSPFELATTGVAVAGMGFFLFAADDVLPAPTPSMGAPEPGSVDWRFTHWANPEPTPDQWLGGVPDYGGYAAPALTIAFYATGAIGNAVSDDFFFPDTAHEAIAFTEALAWTMVTVNSLKYIAGRRRPLTVRSDVDAESFGVDEADYNLSFPSGHSASAAVTSTFLALDLGDYLIKGPLGNAPDALKFTVGRVIPLVAAGGFTWTVMYSRIKDQRHWLSDTLTGAFIGSAFATAFYVMHFDEDGDPRRRHAPASGPASAIVAPAVTPDGGFQLSYGFMF